MGNISTGSKISNHSHKTKNTDSCHVWTCLNPDWHFFEEARNHLQSTASSPVCTLILRHPIEKKTEIKHSRPKNDFQFFVPGDHPVCSCVSLVSFLTVYIRCLKKVKAGTAPWAKGSHPQTWDQRPSRAKASPSVATSEWVSLMMYQQYIHPTDISERQDMILKHHSLGVFP